MTVTEPLTDLPETPAVPTQNRLLRAVLADVVAALVRDGVIPNNRAALVQCGSTLGLSRQDLEAAARRATRGDGIETVPTSTPVIYVRAPRRGRHVEFDLGEPDPPPDTGKYRPRTKPSKPSRVRERATIGGTVHLRCTGCKDLRPITEFRERADRPGQYLARCQPCQRSYQRARHVKVAVLDNMRKVGVRFLLDDDSTIIGMACTRCGESFAAGDTAEGSTGLRHTVCPTRR